jgi:hypothetical protein
VLTTEAHSLPDTGPRLRSRGKPLSNAEVKVVGADDVEVQTVQAGETVARSPSEYARLLEPGGGNRDDDPGRLAAYWAVLAMSTPTATLYIQIASKT